MRLSTALLLTTFPAAALAEAPKVVTDIPPVHSLVAQLMDGIGEPVLLVPGQQSPHGFSMRPSDARAIQEADLIVAIGPKLTPWLSEAAESIAPDTELLALLDHATTLREMEAHDHDHDHGHGHDEAKHDDHDEHGHEDHAEGEGHEDHGHDDHADHKEHDDHDHGDHKEEEHAHDDHGHDNHKDEEHAHDEHKDHDDHGHEDHADHDDHDDHGDETAQLTTDPHAWLDPVNAQAWLAVIADHLAEIDPDNADKYRAAAKNAPVDADKLATKLASVEGRGFVAYHDAYGYFTDRFGLVSKGAVASDEGAAPSAADLRAVDDLIKSGEVSCILTEPQFSGRSLSTVADGAKAKVVEVDPLGANLTPGPQLYGQLITNMATAFEECLSS